LDQAESFYRVFVSFSSVLPPPRKSPTRGKRSLWRLTRTAARPPERLAHLARITRYLSLCRNGGAIMPTTLGWASYQRLGTVAWFGSFDRARRRGWPRPGWVP